jgi:hypothetical protein
MPRKTSPSRRCALLLRNQSARSGDPQTRTKLGCGQTRWLSFLLLIVACVNTSNSLAQDAPIQVKRTFVPNDTPESWPDRKKDWVPISSNELDQLLTDANSASDADRRILWLDQADYNAVFDPTSNTLSGEMSLRWRSSEFRPVLLPLEPSNLSIRSNRWLSSKRVAIVGSDPAGKQWVVSDDEEDELLANWSRPGRKKLAGIEFDVKIPQALVSAIHLSLPSGWSLQSSNGLVQKIVPKTTAASPSDVRDANAVTTQQPVSNLGARDGKTTQPPKGSESWRIDLGTATNTRITLTPTRLAAAAANRQFVWTQRTRVSVRSGSIDAITDLDLTPLGEALPDSIDVVIPVGFSVQSIEQDNVGTTWSKSASSTRILIPLKSNQTGSDLRLTMNLRRSINTTSRIEIAPPRVVHGMFQSGLVSVSVSSPIVVATYAINGMRQIEANATDDLMQMGFRQFQPVADILITGSRANDNAQRINVREYAVFDDNTNGKLTIDLELVSQDRGQFEFRGLFPRLWEITDVRYVGQPETARLQWAFERPTGKKTKRQATHQVLRIQFADGLPFKKSIQLRISAELPSRTNRKRGSFYLPAILSLYEGSMGLVLGANSAESWRISGQPNPGLNQLNPLTLDELKSAAKWAINAQSDAEDSAIEPTLAWSSFVWDNAVEFASTKIEHQTDALIADDKKADNQDDEDNREAAKDDPAPSNKSTVDIDSSTVPVVSMKLMSRIAPGAGRDEHALSWRFIYDVPLEKLNFKLPPQASLLQLDFNGESVSATEDDGTWQVPLSAINAGDELTVKYTLPSQNVYLRETYRCQIPSADVNIAGCRWSVQVPRSVAIVDFSPEFTREDEGQASNMLSWLFGPLGRAKSSTPFQVLKIDSWQTEFERGSITDTENASQWSTAEATCATSPQSLTIHVCDRDRLRSMSWFVLVMTMLIGVSLRVARVKTRGRVGLVWLTSCIAASTIVPAIYAEMIGSAILGTLFSTLIPRSMIRPSRKTQNVPPEEAMPSTVSLQRLPAGMVVLIALLSWPIVCSSDFLKAFENSAWAQSGDASASNTKLESIEVLVPYIGRQFPADETKNVRLANRVFIKSTDLRALTRLAKKSPSKPIQALISSARYVVSHPTDERPQIKAKLNIAVLIQPRNARSTPESSTGQSGSSEVVLPIPARFLSGRDSCRIDGVSIPVLPDADGENVRITIPHPSQWERLTGRRSAPPLPTEETEIPVAEWKSMALELELLPESLVREDLQILRLPIPAVANTTLEMQIDPNSKVRIGRETVSPNANGMYSLEPLDLLELAWGSSSAIAKQVDYSVSLNSHLEFHPTWIERKTFARYKISQGALHQVSWNLPRGAQVDLSSINADQLSDVQIQHGANGVTLVVDFNPPQVDSANVSFSWKQFNRTSEVNQPLWEIPSLRPGLNTPAPISNHTIAVLAANGFRLQDDSLTPANDDAVAAWLKNWPSSAAPRRPLIITSMDRFEPSWASVVPLQTFRTVLRQDQIIRISESSAEWEFKAELSTPGVPVFRHTLFVGNDVVIDSVAVESDDVDRLSHSYWDRRKGTVYLQLKAPTTGTQNVTLRGRLLIANGRTLPVPNARFENATTNSTMLIYHPADIHVHVDGAKLEESGGTRPDEESSGKQSITGRFQLRGLERIQLSLERIRKAPRGYAVARFRPSDETDRHLVDLKMQLDSISDDKIIVRLPKWNLGNAKPDLRFDENQLKWIEAESNDSRLVFDVLKNDTGSFTIAGLFSLPIEKGTLSIAPPTVDEVVLESIVERPISDSSLDRQLEDADLDRLRVVCPGLSDFDSTTQRFSVWNASSEFDVQLQDDRELATFVMHVIRTGRRRPAAGITRIFLNAQPGATNQTQSTKRTEFTLNMPPGAQVISVRVDGQYESILMRGDAAVLSVEPGQHQLDVLWHQQKLGQQLKIRRSQLELPTLDLQRPAYTYCMIVPSKGTTVSGVKEFTKPHIIAMLALSSQWLDSNNSEQTTERPVPSVLLARMLTELKKQDSSEDYSIQIGGLLERLDHDAVSTEIGASDSWLGLTNENPVVTVLESNKPVEMWVVDQRLNQLLLGIFAAVLAAPFLAIFLRLETSDLLARYPMLSWCLIGLVWWTCLIGSRFGFVLFVLTLLTLITQWFLARHRKSVLAHSNAQV